jgi:hypothetical protein
LNHAQKKTVRLRRAALRRAPPALFARPVALR